MAQLHNFIALGRSTVVDIDSKMVLLRGHFEYDDRSQGFGIIYDPNINSNNLWRKITEEEIRDYYEQLHIPRPRNDLVPNISGAGVRVPLFSLDVVQAVVGEGYPKDEAILTLEISDEYYRSIIRDLKNSKLYSDDTSFEQAIERAINLVVYWYRMNWTTELLGKFRSAKILLGGAFCKKLPTFRELSHRQGEALQVLLEKLES